MNSFKNWVIGTSLLCAVILGLGAFLVVKPQLDEASDLRDQTATLVASNDDLAGEVQVLKQQFAHIDEYRAALAEASVRIPQQADISAILREIDATAAATGVTVIVASPGQAQAWAPPEAPADAGADADAEADADADEGNAGAATAQDEVAAAATAGEDPVAAALAAALADQVMTLDGFFSVPISVDVVGSYPNVRAFMDTLQRGTERYYAVGDLTLTRLEPADPAGGRPPAVEGDVEVAMAVSAFVLTPQGQTAAEQPTTEDPATPLPSGDRNPFTG